MPGQTITRSIQVINYDHNDDCDLQMSVDNDSATPLDFPQRIFTFLRGNSTPLYGADNGSGNATSDKSLQDIFDASYIDFGVVTKAGGSVTYEWTVTLDTSMNNDHQGASAIFDFSIHFECGEEGDDDDDDEGERWGGDLLGAATSFFAPFFSGPVVTELEEEVAGVTTEEIPEEMVKGIGVCVDPWWWWFFFILQFVIHWFIYLVIKEKHVDKKKRFFVLQILNTGVFMYIFWKNFCPGWDVLVSMIIGLFWLFLTKRKFDKLEEDLLPRKRYTPSK